jgi:hypothetical protein
MTRNQFLIGVLAHPTQICDNDGCENTGLNFSMNGRATLSRSIARMTRTQYSDGSSINLFNAATPVNPSQIRESTQIVSPELVVWKGKISISYL